METLELSESLSATDVTITIVKPLLETARRGIIDATATDLVFADVYCRSVFAYRSGNNPDASASLELVRRMKDSLEKVLTVFYPFAGRWVATSQRCERQLLCNDAGVPFIEAYVDEDLDHLLPVSGVKSLRTFQPTYVSALYVKSYEVLGMDSTLWTQEMRAGGLPPIFIQVTRCKCGGVVVSPTYTHMHTDGNSFFHFMKAWSDIALTGQTAITPDFDRALAEPEDLFPALAGVEPTSTLRPRLQEGSHLFSIKVFEVSKSVIESMKRGVTVETSGSRYVSTMDCICAHFWQAMSRLPSSITGAENLMVKGLVEGRTRFFDPPLSKYLCGNVIIPMVYPNVPVSELVENPTTFAALKIREHRDGIPQPEWFSAASRKAIRIATSDDKVAKWTNTSWIGFPVYDIDFGFGKPFFAFPATSLPSIDRDLGRVVICPPIPSKCRSAATLHIEILPRIIDALSSDSEFMSMFLD